MSKKLLFLITLFAVFSLSAFGQANLGTLKGFVIDENGAAIVGATITLSSDALMGERTSTSAVKGAYRFVSLPPGAYNISVNASNYKAFEQTEIVIRAGQTINLNANLQLGEFSDVITIVGQAPVIDVESTKQKVNISGELQRMLPTTTRGNFSEVLRLIPGSTMSDPNRPQYTYYSVKGASAYTENNWTIDGAKLNQWEWSYMSARISLDVVDDVEVGLSGGNASAPLGQGTTVHLITKSGGNDYSGTAGFRYQPTAWNWSNVEGGTPSDTDLKEYSFSAGGYLIKDKLWFFGSGRYTTINEGMSRSSELIAKAQAAYPSFSPDLIDKTTKDAFGKITYMLNSNNQFTFGWQQDWGYETFAGGAYDPSAYIDEGTVGPVFNGTWDWFVNDNLNVRSQVSYSDKDRERVGRNPEAVPTFVYEDTYMSGGLIYGQSYMVAYGNYYGAFAVDEQMWQITSDAKYFIDDFKGSHDLSFGIYARPLSENTYLNFYPTSPARRDYVISDPNDYGSSQILFHERVFDDEELAFTTAIGQNYAVYANNIWKPNERLSIEAGLRYDYIAQADEVNDNRVDLISFGALSPNLGFNYVLTEDRKNIMRGSYSIRHQNVTAYTMPTSGQGYTYGVTNYYDTDLNGSFDTTIRTDPRYDAPLYAASDYEDLKLGFSHDFTVGFSRELPGSSSASVNYTFRKFVNELDWYDINPIIENGVYQGVVDPTLPYGEDWRVLNNEWGWKEYHSVDVTFDRPLSNNFQVMAGYTYEFGTKKGDWSPYDPEYWLDSGKYADFAGDKGHAFRLNGLYMAPYGFSISGSIQGQGGSRSGYIYEILSASDPDVTSRGAAWMWDGQWISNPLSDTRRIKGDDRQDNQWRTPMIWNTNIRVARDFTYREHKLTVSVDFFNLLNSATSLGVKWADREFGSSNFGRDNPDYILAPRAALMMFKYSF